MAEYAYGHQVYLDGVKPRHIIVKIGPLPIECPCKLIFKRKLRILLSSLIDGGFYMAPYIRSMMHVWGK